MRLSLDTWLAVKAQLVGSLLMTAGALIFKEVLLTESAVSTLAGSWVRILMNVAVALVVFRLTQKGARWRQILGQRRAWLLVFGLLGSSTITCFFVALDSLGVGPASFLLSTSGMFLVGLHALYEGRLPARGKLLACFFTLVGMLFLAPPGDLPLTDSGFLFGLASGFFAAIAYFVVGQKLVDESPTSAMFYWGGVNLLVYIVMFNPLSLEWPKTPADQWLLLASGLFGALGQFWVNKSYASHGNWLIGIVAYVGPIMAMPFEAAVFGTSYQGSQYLGAIFISLATLVSLATQRHLTSVGTTSAAG